MKKSENFGMADTVSDIGHILVIRVVGAKIFRRSHEKLAHGTTRRRVNRTLNRKPGLRIIAAAVNPIPSPDASRRHRDPFSLPHGEKQ